MSTKPISSSSIIQPPTSPSDKDSRSKGTSFTWSSIEKADIQMLENDPLKSKFLKKSKTKKDDHKEEETVELTATQLQKKLIAAQQELERYDNQDDGAITFVAKQFNIPKEKLIPKKGE